MNLNYFLEFLKINFLMWPTKKNLKLKKKSQVSATYADLVSWMVEGCIPDFFFLQRYKSN